MRLLDDGLSECLLPFDFNSTVKHPHGAKTSNNVAVPLITDDELSTWLCCSLPAGVKLTCVIDGSAGGSCLNLPFQLRLTPAPIETSVKPYIPGSNANNNNVVPTGAGFRASGGSAPAEAQWITEKNPLYALAHVTVLCAHSDAGVGEIRDLRSKVNFGSTRKGQVGMFGHNNRQVVYLKIE